MVNFSGNNAGYTAERLCLFTIFILFVFFNFSLQSDLAAQSEPVLAGYRDYNYGSQVTSKVTGEKPQSKLWWHDGFWWGNLWDPDDREYKIHQFNSLTQSWEKTSTAVDDRGSTKSDVLWDGEHLYVASHFYDKDDAGPTSTGNSARLYRFSYAEGSYSLDAGFPVIINGSKSETLVIDKDTTGQLWISWIEDRKVKVNRSTINDLTWGEPFTLPVQGGNTGSENDISSIVAFGDGKIGIFWSNQSDEANYFAVHHDEDPDEVWQARETALEDNSLGAVADNHINMKAACDSTGAVYVAAKTSLGGNRPLVYLLKRDSTGTWSRHIYGYGQEGHTRPVVLVDHENELLYVFATSDKGDSGKDVIYMKVSDINDISFSSGLGIPVIESEDNNGINNVTSTKQCIGNATGFLVLASDHISRDYFHNYLGPGEVKPVIFSFSPSGGLVGTSVTIRGLNFTGVTGISFGAIPATDFSIISDNEIQVTVPEGAESAPISITNLEGTNTSVNSFAIGAPPVLEALADEEMDEGATLNVPVAASGSGNSEIILTVENLPDFGSFTDNGDGSGNIRFTPAFDDGGQYPDIKIIASNEDNELLFDETTFLLTVNNINRMPQLTALENQVVGEGDSLELVVSASDPDGDDLAITADNIPDFAEFSDEGDGVGLLRFLPGYEDAADYQNIQIMVEDDGSPALSETIEFDLTVEETNRAPQIADFESPSLNEGDSLTLTINASDADGDDIQLSSIHLPHFGSFTDNGGGGSMTLTPEFEDAGFYDNIQIIAIDNGDPAEADTFRFSVTVGNINRPPAIAAVSVPGVSEGATLALAVSAGDADGDSLTLNAMNLPQFAEFSDSGNGGGSFLFSPDFQHAGTYKGIAVIASDNGSPSLSDTMIFDLTVHNFNLPPIALDDDLTIEEDTPATIAVLANDNDPDGDALIIERILEGVSGSAAISPGDTTIAYSPAPDSSGTDFLQYVVKDSLGGLDTATVTISITPVNDWPVISGLPDSLKFPADAFGSINIWEIVNDVESPDDALLFDFSAAPDTFQLDFHTDTGILDIHPKNDMYRSVAQLIINVTDPDGQRATARDTIQIVAESIVGIEGETGHTLPEAFVLLQNYPNPFNPSTTIPFSLPAAARVSLKIYNTLGEEVKTLVSTHKPAGQYTIIWNAQNNAALPLPSGVYFYRITAGNFSDVKKMLLVR